MCFVQTIITDADDALHRAMKYLEKSMLFNIHILEKSWKPSFLNIDFIFLPGITPMLQHSIAGMKDFQQHDNSLNQWVPSSILASSYTHWGKIALGLSGWLGRCRPGFKSWVFLLRLSFCVARGKTLALLSKSEHSATVPFTAFFSLRKLYLPLD